MFTKFVRIVLIIVLVCTVAAALTACSGEETGCEKSGTCGQKSAVKAAGLAPVVKALGGNNP